VEEDGNDGKPDGAALNAVGDETEVGGGKVVGFVAAGVGGSADALLAQLSELGQLRCRRLSGRQWGQIDWSGKIGISGFRRFS
jgi:hypothetical protein